MLWRNAALIVPLLASLATTAASRKIDPADAIADRSGADTLAFVTDLLQLDVRTLNHERIPATGRWPCATGRWKLSMPSWIV